MATKYKSAPVFGQSPVIDGNVIKGVVIVKEGKDKVGDYFPVSFLHSLSEQGNSYPQGVKSRFGHPNMCKDSLGTYLGRYKNFRVEQMSDGHAVLADLHLDEVAAKSPDGDLLTYVKNMAERNPDMFGNSIVFTGEGEDITIDGEQMVKLSLRTFMASDLVDSPAATDGLFKSSEDLGVIMTEFLDENPQVMDVIAKDPGIIRDFFQKRYIPYLEKRKNISNMDILKKVGEILGITSKDVDLPLKGGDVVTVVTDKEQPEVGDLVTFNGEPVADGEHELNDGRTLVTVDGVITEIKEPSAEEVPVTLEGAEEITKGLDEIRTLVSGLADKIKSIEDVTGKLDALSKTVEDHGKAIQLIAKNVKSEYVAPVADPARGDDDPVAKRSIGNKFIKKVNS